MASKSTIFALLFLPFFLFSEEYEFKGQHFIASYYGCDSESLTDSEALRGVMNQAAEASGATVLTESYYLFDEGGMTQVLLLSESHASIHTYPEHNACFVDLFTCGDTCQSEPFHQTLKEFLKPAHTELEIIRRE